MGLTGAKKLFIVSVAAALVTFGAAAWAEDNEKPLPSAATTIPTTVFGDTTIQTNDIIGSAIDAKDAIDPVVTVLLTLGDMDTSSNGAVVLTVQPVMDAAAQ